MVTNYLNNTNQYRLDKLKDKVYLFDGTSNIFIDDGSCYVSNVNPTEFKCRNVKLTEQTEFDERYAFTKELSFTIDGRLDVNDLPTSIYVVVESFDGTLWCVNPQYPMKLSYTFTLSDAQNETTVTLRTQGNMPTLKCNVTDGSISETTTCKEYKYSRFIDLYLVESDYARYDNSNNRLKLSKDLVKIDYNKNSATLVEEFDGESTTTTITFSIPMDSYKTDWQYRLLEFMQNTYIALVTADDLYKYYCGTEYALQPSYTIDSDGGIITITLRESSLRGIVKVYDSQLDIDHTYTWEYVTEIDGVDVFECSGGPGIAKYILREKTDAVGNPLGEYRCRKDIWDYLQEEEEYYVMNFGYLLQYNIVGVWDDVPQNWFPTWKCAYKGADFKCELTTDIPRSIIFTSSTSYSFSLNASCDWNISSQLPNYLSISPLSGNADTTYTITVRNTSTPTQYDKYATFSIDCCNTSYAYSVTVQEAKDCITPSDIDIDCMPQTVQFIYQGDCPLNIAGIDESLTYSLQNNILTVRVPRNYSTEAVDHTIIVTNCNCGESIDVLTIHQDKTYENWVQENSYICEDGNKYQRLQRYTGITSSDISYATSEYKKGNIIESNSSDCKMKNSRFVDNGHFYCIDGNKYLYYEEEEQSSFDGGQTWTQWQPTGSAQLGSLVESESDFCNQTETISWRLINKSICYNP
ncbi:MAG: hypothetical protein J6S67_13635 [Methanobrevibacter sp.]|nr:hypothetical protein [Methanobrevibacter sp.]